MCAAEHCRSRPRPEVAVATVVRHDGATHTDASPRGSHCGVFIDVNDVGDYPSCTGGTTAIITTTTATTTPARAHTTAHLEHNGMGGGRVHTVFRLKLALVGTVRPLRTGHRPRACRGSSSTRLHRAENVCALRSVSVHASIAIHPIDTAFLRPHLLWPIAWWPPTIVSSGLQIDTHPKELLCGMLSIKSTWSGPHSSLTTLITNSATIHTSSVACESGTKWIVG